MALSGPGLRLPGGGGGGRELLREGGELGVVRVGVAGRREQVADPAVRDRPLDESERDVGEVAGRDRLQVEVELVLHHPGEPGRGRECGQQRVQEHLLLRAAEPVDPRRARDGRASHGLAVAGGRGVSAVPATPERVAGAVLQAAAGDLRAGHAEARERARGLALRVGQHERSGDRAERLERVGVTLAAERVDRAPQLERVLDHGQDRAVAGLAPEGEDLHRGLGRVRPGLLALDALAVVAQLAAVGRADADEVELRGELAQAIDGTERAVGGAPRLAGRLPGDDLLHEGDRRRLVHRAVGVEHDAGRGAHLAEQRLAVRVVGLARVVARHDLLDGHGRDLLLEAHAHDVHGAGHPGGGVAGGRRVRRRRGGRCDRRVRGRQQGLEGLPGDPDGEPHRDQLVDGQVAEAVDGRVAVLEQLVLEGPPVHLLALAAGLDGLVVGVDDGLGAGETGLKRALLRHVQFTPSPLAVRTSLPIMGELWEPTEDAGLFLSKQSHVLGRSK